MFMKNNKAQAATELAILGSLIIVAFSYLMMYSEKLNREQSYIMQTFRHAMKEAYDGGGSANYTRIVHQRTANITDPMRLGQLDTYSSSASLVWGTDGGEYDKIDVDGVLRDGPKDDNENGIPDVEEGKTIEDKTVSNTEVTEKIDKELSLGVNSTTRTLDAEDTIHNTKESEYDVTVKLGNDDRGKYSASGGGLHRYTTWSTPE